MPTGLRIGIWVAAVAVAAGLGGLRAETVQVSTDEGTWMNVDVSPDGRQVVFDLLGNIYRIPIEGGDAVPVLEGRHWETQPRFSPDGTRLVFISDRSGADNIWTASASGGDPRQVTAEREHILNAPDWSPDGASIVARKHHVGKRTVGAGAIWLYPASGGAGRELAGPASLQKDQNEPVFSPLGDSILYSVDISPGHEFTYNKNPYRGIFAIFRHDLKRGTAAPIIGGIGGAVRPLISPDGRYVSYISRRELKTVLIAKDTQSGEERVLFEALDTDLQELWANSGYYPAYDWLPNGEEIVFWSGGKIRRVAVATGEVRDVPFRVRQAFEVTAPVKAKRQSLGPSFPVKALRWTQVSPKGDRVAFQALGKIYVADLAGGKPRRLTGEESLIEAFPAFSPDGDWVVYATWHDDELGSVRRTSLTGGETHVITRKPGHYVEPAASTDGARVAYRQVPANPMVAPKWATAPGVYENSWEGGAERLVTEDGSLPQYCGDGVRMFVMRRQPRPSKPPESWWPEDRSLVEVSREEATARPLITTDFAEEIRISSDCRWLAVVERGDVYVSAVDGERRRLPGDGGRYLSWSRDGRLFWSLGPDIHSVRLRGDSPDLEPKEARNVGFSAETDKPEQTIALVGGRIITMRGDEVIEDGVIVVRSGRIAEVGRTRDVEIPADAFVLPLEGRTVAPGMIDAHFHGHMKYGVRRHQTVLTRRNWQYYATLAFGVTTVYEPYALSTADIFADSELAKAGLIVAPRILSTGTALYGAEDEIKAVIDGPDDARKAVGRRAAYGAGGVKSYLQPRRDQRRQIIAAAREQGLLVTAEASMSPANAMAYVVDGHSSIEHRSLPARLYDDVVQLWSQTEVAYTPTILINTGGVPGENYWYARDEVWKHPILSRFVPMGVLFYFTVRRQVTPDADNSFLQPARSVKRLHDAGVRVLVGAHGQREGLSYHWELWHLAKGGMAPHDILRAATLDAARHFGLDSDLGSVEVGKLADLVVFEHDPLDDIYQSDRVTHVMMNGRLYEAATMDEIGPTPKPRDPFYFE